MFFYYLDSCNTALWKLFGVGLWGCSLLLCGYFAFKLLAVHGDRKSLERAGITGSTYEKLKPKTGRRLTRFLLSLAALVGILWFYVDFFWDFECTPASALWVGALSER